MFAIKAEIRDPHAETFVFETQKTTYGDKRIAAGDAIFLFASGNEGGQDLAARGVVVSAQAVPEKNRGSPGRRRARASSRAMRHRPGAAWGAPS